MTVIPTTDDLVDYLLAHGFTLGHSRGWYEHTDGRARVDVTNAEVMGFTVYAFTWSWGVRWTAQLYQAPLPVVVATLTAALV
jgi:hypothetical protein